MPTINQLSKLGRKPRLKKCKTPHLRHCPQRSGTADIVELRSPKKPNSAKRKVVHLYTTYHGNIIAYAPGERNGVYPNSKVLFRGGRPKDLPGIRYKLIPGKYALPAVLAKTRSRSKYGVRIYEYEGFYSTNVSPSSK